MAHLSQPSARRVCAGLLLGCLALCFAAGRPSASSRADRAATVPAPSVDPAKSKVPADRDAFFARIQPHLRPPSQHVRNMPAGEAIRLEANDVCLDGGGTTVPSIEVKGSGITIRNFVTQNISVVGNQNVITRNRVTRGGIFTKGASNEIAFNEVAKFERQGIEVLGKDEAGIWGCWIHHNYIHDVVGNGDNGHEAIRILTNVDAYTNALIERNLMERVSTAKEPEAISLKTSGNFICANTLRDSPDSSITCRNASYCVICDNVGEKSASITVRGDGHRLLHNSMDISLRAGNCTMDSPRCKTKPVPCANGVGGYMAARHASLEANRGAVTLGEAFDPKKETFLPADNRIAGQAGKIVKRYGDERTDVTGEAKPDAGARTPALTPADVGVAAPAG